MTALFGRRKVLASTETKPGRSPKNVDYVGARHGFFILSMARMVPELVGLVSIGEGLAGGVHTAGAQPVYFACSVATCTLLLYLCRPGGVHREPSLYALLAHQPPAPCCSACAGLEAGSDRLTLYVHSPDTVKQLLLPPSFMRRFPNLQIRTDLVDMQVRFELCSIHHLLLGVRHVQIRTDLVDMQVRLGPLGR